MYIVHTQSAYYTHKHIEWERYISRYQRFRFICIAHLNSNSSILTRQKKMLGFLTVFDRIFYPLKYASKFSLYSIIILHIFLRHISITKHILEVFGISPNNAYLWRSALLYLRPNQSCCVFSSFFSFFLPRLFCAFVCIEFFQFQFQLQQYFSHHLIESPRCLHLQSYFMEFIATIQ